MANNPYDRVIVNPLERPLSVDADRPQSQADRSIRDTLRRMYQIAGTPQSGFLDTSLKVVENSPTGMSVLITPGVGFQDLTGDLPTAIGGITGVDDLSPYKPLPLNATMSIAVDAAPGAGQERYDIIEVKTDRRSEDNLSRDVLNTGTGLFVPTLVNKTLAFSLDGRNGRVVSPSNSTTGVGYKVGTAAAVGTAVVPSTSPGYVPIATIYVGPTVTSILNANITDRRVLLAPVPADGTITTAKLADLAVTTAKIAALAVTRPKLAALGQQVSSSSGAFSTASGAFVDVTNLSVTITTTGRPVVIALESDGGGLPAYVGTAMGTAGATVTPQGSLRVLRGATEIAQVQVDAALTVSAGTITVGLDVPPPGVLVIDAVAAGTYTYKLQAKVTSGTNTKVAQCVLVAYEL